MPALPGCASGAGAVVVVAHGFAHFLGGGDQLGQVDYWLKSEASLARDVLATVQEVREAVREGRHNASS